jgi:ABC-type sulfate/molybdate transport systems ATPase subunit
LWASNAGLSNSCQKITLQVGPRSTSTAQFNQVAGDTVYNGGGLTGSLNIIAAARVDGTVGGTLSVNGTAITPDLAAAYRSMVGFVHQDDRLIEYLTVQQCIFHAARMRLPLPISNANTSHSYQNIRAAQLSVRCRSGSPPARLADRSQSIRSGHR